MHHRVKAGVPHCERAGMREYSLPAVQQDPQAGLQQRAQESAQACEQEGAKEGLRWRQQQQQQQQGLEQ